MRKGNVLPLILFAGCGVIFAVLWWANSSQAQINSLSTQTDRPSSESPIDRLNQESLAAQNGELASVKKLVDVIINDFIPVQIAPDTMAELKERLVLAETSYRKGGKGVSETDVSRTVNELVEKFDAPEYARTTPSQVRYLRNSVLGTFPNLIGKERDGNKQPMKVGSSISGWLSPAEAVFLTALMLQQKMINEDFQVEPKA